MMQSTGSRPLARRVLIVDNALADATNAAARSVRGLATELRARNMEVVESLSCEDGLATVDLRFGHPLHSAQLDPGRE